MAEEWRRLCAISSRYISLLMGVGIGAVLLSLYFEQKAFFYLFLILFPFFLLISYPVLEKKFQDKRSLKLMLVGFFYLCLAMVVAILIRKHTHGIALGIWIITIVIATDIGGFCFGRVIGGWKLAPKVSPGKTWSGFLGGIMLSLLSVVILFSMALTPIAGMSLVEISLITLFVSLMAQMGDLIESGLKRRVGQKDSSGFIPGHGGILDRLDGFLLALPVFYASLWFMGHVKTTL